MNNGTHETALRRPTAHQLSDRIQFPSTNRASISRRTMGARADSLDPSGKSKILQLVLGALFLLILAFAAVRLSTHRSPTIDVAGSYFPAWILCIISGLTLTLICHWIVQVRRLKDYVGPGAVIYPCLALIFAFLTWIFLYQN